MLNDEEPNIRWDSAVALIKMNNVLILFLFILIIISLIFLKDNNNNNNNLIEDYESELKNEPILKYNLE